MKKAESYLLNLAGLLEMETHFETMVIKTRSGKNQ